MKKVIELVLEETEGLNGINAISIVEHPAIEENFITLAKEYEVEFKAQDEEKRILMGAALIPNKTIYRNQGGEEFYVYFSKETVRKASELFLMRGYQGNTTLEHAAELSGLSVVESWIVEDPQKDKTELTSYTPQGLMNLDGVTGWLLYDGTYDITFNEGCKIPANRVGLIRQRSSMLRNGTVLHSSVFDPGFETEFMGTVMVVNEPIFIEENARVAQIYFHECEPVSEDNLYNGQWQGDTQRNK